MFRGIAWYQIMSVISAMIRSVDPVRRTMQSKYTYLVSMKVFVLLKIFRYSPEVRGFPSGASGEEPVCQCRRHKRSGFSSWVRKNLRADRLRIPSLLSVKQIINKDLLCSTGTLLSVL